LKLKGIGVYTASAIASFAYGLPYAVVDGNVYRVLSRYFGKKEPIDSSHGKKMYEKLAHELLLVEDTACYNQAIMDFGATVCKPQLPECKQCVLQAGVCSIKKRLGK
jgi:A/G-specific adenine glycosylase